MKPTTEIRNQIRAARRALEPKIRKRHSTNICQHIFEFESYRAANRVAAYLAFDGEADPMEVMVSAVDQGKQVYLPIIVGKTKPLVFAPWTPSTPMKTNRFNICEPEVDSAEYISADQLDFVISPLVAFDAQCNRIGVGGGFYDRTFGFLKEPGNRRAVHLVGFAFELQKLPSIQSQEWDVRLDSVVTEDRVYC